MFDLTKLEVSDDFDLLKPGQYPVYVERLEWKEPKNGGKEYLNLMFKVFEGPGQDRVIFNMYNLFYESTNQENAETTRQIAWKEIKKMLLASGCTEDKLKFETKEQLSEMVLTVRCKIKVGVRKSADYGDQNTVKGYMPLDNGTPVEATNVPF